MLQFTTLLNQTADTVLALQCSTQIIREHESDLRDRHLLLARRPEEHRLHCYADHNSEAPGHYTIVHHC